MSPELLKQAGLAVVKGAVRFMKIGVIQTAAFNLNEAGKNEMKSVSSDVKDGYKYNVAPKLKGLKIIKGDK